MSDKLIYGKVKIILSDLNRNTLQHFGWLLPAFFLMDSWWLLDGAAVYATGRPAPALFHVFSMVLTLILGMVPAAVFFKKTAGTTIRVGSALYVVGCGLFINTAAAFLMRAWAGSVPVMAGSGGLNVYTAGILYLALVMVIASLVLYLSLYTIAFIIHNIPLNKAGKLWLCFTGVCFRRIPLFVLLVLGAALVFVLLLNLVKAGEALLAGSVSAGFFARYFLTIMTAAAKAVFVILMISFTRLLLKDREADIRQIGEESKGGSLLFPVALVTLCFVLSLYPLLQSKSGLARAVNDIRCRVYQADQMRNAGNGFAAAAEYAGAKADLLVLKGFLTGIEELRQGDDLLEAGALLDEAELADGNSPYLNYFKGLLVREKNPLKEADPDVHSIFAAAARQADSVPEAVIWTLNGYRAQNEEHKRQDGLNLLIARGVFKDRFWRELALDDRALASYKADLEQLESIVHDRELFVILERARYEDTGKVAEELIEYSAGQENPGLSYYIARLAEEIPYPDYMYTYAKKYYEGIRNTSDSEEEIEGALFASCMYIRSGHPAESVKLMEEKHKKYPGNADIASDYAYALLEDQKPEQAVAVIDSLEGEKTAFQLYIKALACMEAERYPETLEAMRFICEKLNSAGPASAELKRLEDYIYRFALECNHVLESRGNESGERFIDEVKKTKEQNMVYHYVMGFEAWRDGDYESSNAHFEKILSLNGSMTYPYYLLGINYNEMAGSLKKDCYAEAEKCFLNFIERRPDVPEAYFCLGFVYKHSGDSARAERAFNKVILMNPYRDNPLNEGYGMYNHARKEVNDW